MHEDGRRWDERYATTTHVEAHEPEAIKRWPELRSLLPQTGHCLDVACGLGGVTLWVASRGLEVTALDASHVAIEVLERAAARVGTADQIDARVVDLDDGLSADLNDFDLVVCQRFRDPALFPAIIDRLRIGGVAIVTVLSSVGADHPGAFHAPPQELRTAFTDERCEILRHDEGDGIAHIVIRRR